MTARYLKAGLLELCITAEQLGVEVDPDGLIGDRHVSKLTVEGGEHEIPPLLSDYSTNIGILQRFSIFDIYNYLISFTDYTHGTFRDVTKMEAYSMAKDCYVQTVMAVPYTSHDGYHAILIRIKSALCHCKGGYVWYAWILHIKYFLHCQDCGLSYLTYGEQLYTKIWLQAKLQIRQVNMKMITHGQDFSSWKLQMKTFHWI